MATPSPNPYLAGASPHSASQQQPQQKLLHHHPYRRKDQENQSTRNQNSVMHQQHQQYQQQQPQHTPKHNPYHNRTSQTAAIAPKTALTLLREHRASKSKRLYLLQRSNDNDVDISKQEKDEWMALGNGIHELAGEAGTGKTQVALSLCMQAAISAVTPTMAAAAEAELLNPVTNKKGCRALYISLGKASMPKVLQRLLQMAEAWTQQNAAAAAALDQQQQQQQQQQHSTTTTSTSTATTAVQVLSRIMTRAVVNQDDLFDLLRHEMPALLERETDCQVLVLDSVADLFRGMNHEVKSVGGGKKQDNKNLAADRSATLFSLAAILKQFSDKYHIPIVVLNQVTARISNQPSLSSTFSSSSAVLPALGLSWANCVNTSYILTRQEIATGTSTAFVRRLSLRLSSTAACSQTACLQIEPQGVRLVDR
jgi:RecA/RadA recombinase